MAEAPIPNVPSFWTWLKESMRLHALTSIRSPEGEEYIVLRPEQLAELDAILSDPAFADALANGAVNLAHGETRPLAHGLTLADAASGSLPADATMADAVEKGVDDLRKGATKSLQPGQSLQDLL